MMVDAYSLFGLTVQSGQALPAPPAQTTAPADIRIHWSPSRAIPAEPAPGRVLAQHEVGGHGYAVTALEANYTIRFFSECEFVCDRNLRRIVVYTGRASPELAGLFLVGSVMSTLLTLQGRCVIHASAVALDGLNLAFIGPSGQGKSIVAAALCLTGARVISDDALRCDVVGKDILCYPGAQRLRLRPGARPLVEDTAMQQLSLTVDGRIAFAPRAVRAPVKPLHALVVPSCGHGADSLARLSGAAALTHLAASARVAWWRSPEMRRTQFELMTGLGHQLPIFALTTPHNAIFTQQGRVELSTKLAELKRLVS